MFWPFNLESSLLLKPLLTFPFFLKLLFKWFYSSFWRLTYFNMHYQVFSFIPFASKSWCKSQLIRKSPVLFIFWCFTNQEDGNYGIANNLLIIFLKPSPEAGWIYSIWVYVLFRVKYYFIVRLNNLRTIFFFFFPFVKVTTGVLFFCFFDWSSNFPIVLFFFLGISRALFIKKL